MFLKKHLAKKRWFKSFGWKLTLWYAVLFLITSLVISLFLYHRLKFQLYEEVDLFLADEMNEFSQFVAEHQNSLSLIELQMQKESVAIRKDYQMYYGVLDIQKKLVIQSSEFHFLNQDVRIIKSSILPTSNVKEYKVDNEKGNYVVRILTHEFQGKNEFIRYLQVGMNLTRIGKTLSNFRKNIILTVPVFFILSVAGGFVLARHNLRPISQMTKTASRITALNLDERLPMRGAEDELDKLAQTFNCMIERIKQAYQKISQFSFDAAHELRTPITSLMGEIESALSYKCSPERYHAVLTSNLEELSRLQHLVNSLLFLAQDVALGQEKNKEKIELNIIVRDICELFEPVAKEKGFNFTSDFISEPIYLQGEKWRIEQVISNLIDNAICYNRPGGNVTVKLRKNESFVEIMVKDTGIGISDEDKTKIFDRFYRGEPSRSRHSGGFGLGLSIVKSIVESYFGTILVESRLGEGSTFTVQLPI